MGYGAGMKLEARLEQQPPFTITTEQLAAGDKEAWDLLIKVLDECEGNITHTAEALGVGVRSMFRWLESFSDLQEAVAEWRPVVTGRLLDAGDETAWQALLGAVASCHGNVTHVARELGIPLRTVQYWAHSPRLATAILTARQAGAGIAGRLDETAPTERLSVHHDGQDWLARRGKQTGRGPTPTLAIWALS
jgi:DNA-binding NtrC family response regulator